MRFPSVWLIALFGLLAASSVIFGRSDISERSISEHSERDAPEFTDLVKRKGGGGKGGSSGGGKTGGSSSGGSTGATSGGAPRSYGGGSYYGGGSSAAYRSGSRTPRGLAPAAFLGVGALGFFGGAWLYGAYVYNYNNPYRFYNASSRLNETKPIQCLCQQYDPCGCDDNEDQTYLNSVIGDGTYSKLNSSLVRVADVNGTNTIFLNGTLPNGTLTDDTSSAPGSLRVNPVVGVAALMLAVASAMLAL